MLSNKILSDKPLAGNENRQHIHSSGRYQQMTPCDGSGSAPPRSHNDLPPPIRGDAPMTLDPHGHQRGSNNLSKAPFERPGSHYTSEISRRLHGRGVDYK